ncbi:MAG TPA: transposase domain-containing protein [Pirellulaceae bacterium]|nr:transposase domain-containing protein [Pirellulaceae bacterium]
MAEDAAVASARTAGGVRASGGRVAAAWYSLLASAERHGVDPQHYLTSVLAQLPTATDADLPRLLPNAWQRDRHAAATSPPTA